MEWKHKCDLDWLKERQQHLTASDIKSLIPVTKTGRPRKITDSDRMKVYASKLVRLTEEDCWSYGAAARGHMLEPYAIEEYQRHVGMIKYFWWDDVLVSNGKQNGLAFSPDGMNIPMTVGPLEATRIVEVKSYSAERHLTTAMTPKELIEERWQIATAMAVLPNIKAGTLLLYNPNMTLYEVVPIRFSRDELMTEIEMIYEIEEEWIDFMEVSHLPRLSYISLMSEQDIVKDIEERQRLNP